MKTKCWWKAGVLIWLAMAAVGDGAPVRREVWISPATTGNFYAKGAVGAEDHPLDGGSAEAFDANLNSLPIWTTIHLLPGTFETGGGCHVSLKSGQKVLGSGVDVTIVKLSTNTTLYPYPENTVMASAGGSVSIDVEDLTLDGNYLPGTAYNRHGITLAGTHHTIRRVKVIHCAKFNPQSNSEAWGIVISTYGSHFRDSTRNLIEDCEVSEFAGAYSHSVNLSAIAFIGLTNTPVSGIMRNNRVMGRVDYPCFAYLFGCNGHDELVQGNYAENVTAGCCADTPPGFTNIMVVNNTFNGCECAISFENIYANDITFAFNKVVLTNMTFGWVDAFKFNEQSHSNSSQTNIVIYDNRIENHAKKPVAAKLLAGGMIDGLIFENNMADTSLTNDVWFWLNNSLLCHNKDLQGNERPQFNKEISTGAR